MIIRLAAAGRIVILATREVIRESERNIRAKMKTECLLRFYQLLEQSQLERIESSSPEEEERWTDLVADKDRHILAGALKGGAGILVSLDRKHIVKPDVLAVFPIAVMDTREFLKLFIDQAWYWTESWQKAEAEVDAWKADSPGGSSLTAEELLAELEQLDTDADKK